MMRQFPNHRAWPNRDLYGWEFVRYFHIALASVAGGVIFVAAVGLAMWAVGNL